MRTTTTLSIAVALVASGTFLGASASQFVSADENDSSDLLSFIPIEPCRLVDTRPGANNVGPRASKLGTEQTQVFNAYDPSPCAGAIAEDATSLSTNVTALGATELSFLTIWADGSLPLAASLNPAPGEPPTPNAVTTGLAEDGSFRVFNNAGEAHVIVDVNGYYVPVDGRLGYSLSLGADTFYFETLDSGFPRYDLAPDIGGYPGVQMPELETSTVAAQFTVGLSYDVGEEIGFGISYIPHDDNLIDNPNGCTFVTAFDNAMVLREGVLPFFLDIGSSFDAAGEEKVVVDPEDVFVQPEPWTPLLGGVAPAVLIMAISGSSEEAEPELPEVMNLQPGDLVTVDITRDPMHIDDTCTSDMILTGLNFSW